MYQFNTDNDDDNSEGSYQSDSGSDWNIEMCRWMKQYISYINFMLTNSCKKSFELILIAAVKKVFKKVKNLCTMHTLARYLHLEEDDSLCGGSDSDVSNNSENCKSIILHI